MAKKLLLPFLLLFVVASVVAGNLTVTQVGNVTIACNNQSQCAGTAPGILPFFFTAIDTNTTIPVTLTTTVEQNVTVVQNITYNVTTQNQTVQVTTQNITVVSCNESPNAQAISDAVTNSLATQLQTSLATTCSTACKPGDDERTGLLNQKAEAERQLRECTVMAQAAMNISQTQYEHLNATMTQKVEDLEANVMFAYTIGFIAIIFAAGGAVMIFRKNVLRNFVKGRPRRETPSMEVRE